MAVLPGVVRDEYRRLVTRGINEFHAEQNLGQFSGFLESLYGRELRAIVEIGSFWRGTTWILAQVATSDAIIVTVDDQQTVIPELPVDEIRRDDQQVLCVVGRSQDPRVSLEVEDHLDDRMVDLLFVDGDHTYEGVRSDWAAYLPMVRPGGIVAFHDILNWAPAHRKDEIQVWMLWEELKSCYRTWEFTEGVGTAGIGVLEVPE